MTELLANRAIEIAAPARVRKVLDEIGRTEDVALSPDGTRLALAAFSRNRVYVFSLVARRQADEPIVRVLGSVTLSCDRFAQPHGCAFLENDHLLVCNRGGDVVLVHVPEPSAEARDVIVEPRAELSGKGYLSPAVKTPGSVAVYRIDESRFRAFICSDQWHFVTAHVITLAKRVEIANEGIRIERSLEIPDGIAISPDLAWIAVSNHVRGQVQLFRNSSLLNRRMPPEVVLGGSVCPHGLSFDSGGNLYVADAASPYVHSYRKPAEGWVDQGTPSESIRILDNETFYKGRYAAREGGVKGIHVHTTANLLVTTHKIGTLEFYDLGLRDSSKRNADSGQMDALVAGRDEEIARTKNDVLTREWRFTTRLRKQLGLVAGPVMANAYAVRPLLGRLHLDYVSRRATHSLVDPGGPVLSMTSHATRVANAHLAIESIARGDVKPGRVLLWLSDGDMEKPLPDSLLRLRDRGLEICYTADLGPHTKYFPYLASETRFDHPLVTADDDVIYPHDWLAKLMSASERDAGHIHCHRARRMRLNRYHFEPYNSWGPAIDTAPHPLNFVIGASGVIYPPDFLRVLKSHGSAFRECCPTADDIWLNWVAYRERFGVAQIGRAWPQYYEIPASQLISLSRINVGEGGNQLQLARTYSPDDRANLFRIACEETR